MNVGRWGGQKVGDDDLDDSWTRLCIQKVVGMDLSKNPEDVGKVRIMKNEYHIEQFSA